MEYSRFRRVCESCNQVLGHAAYYRHEKDEIGSVCPAKRSCLQSKTSSSSAQPPLSGGSESVPLVNQFMNLKLLFVATK